MKLNPEAEAEIVRLLSGDAYQHFPAETLRAAMRWAYEDALIAVRDQGDLKARAAATE